MRRAPAALALVAAVAVGLLLVSGGSRADPETPAGLPGLPPPFLGTAVVGEGRVTAAIDAYGDVVDLRISPAGPAWLAVPAARQAAGTVAPEMAIVPRLRLPGGRLLPFWRAEEVSQRYLPGTGVLVTTARFGRWRASVTYASDRGRLICLTSVTSGPVSRRAELEGSRPGATHNDQMPEAGPPEIRLSHPVASAVAPYLRCDGPGARVGVAMAKRSDRRWLATSAPLAAPAPLWARRMYERSLLVLRALTDGRTGAVAAGARDGWAYVWPRDAATAALALRAGGHATEALRVSRFLSGLDLAAAARFRGDGSPVPGRAAQGDAAGWLALAGGTASRLADRWRDRSDYQEKAPGDYLGNAIAAIATEPQAGRSAATAGIARAFEGPRGLARIGGDPGSGPDSAAAWAVRPFALADLYPAARVSLRQLLAGGSRFGIVPSADWPEGDPWSAPTAWSAWAFAALARADGSGARADRRAALHLLADLRRAATPAGTLPERVDVGTGLPRSTTPLAWSHAFAILALRELWPAN